MFKLVTHCGHFHLILHALIDLLHQTERQPHFCSQYPFLWEFIISFTLWLLQLLGWNFLYQPPSNSLCFTFYVASLHTNRYHICLTWALKRSQLQPQRASWTLSFSFLTIGGYNTTCKLSLGHWINLLLPIIFLFLQYCKTLHEYFHGHILEFARQFKLPKIIGTLN